jgi:hypothetical protein
MKTLALTAAATLALGLVAAVPAHADDADRQRSGSCSGSTDWKIKAGPDDGRMEVEAEIDSNRTGQTWRWTLKRDGRLVDRGTSTTRGPSGSFDVERRTANGPGSDTFRFRATHRATGEVCVARVTR